jgi:hypothetical protein
MGRAQPGKGFETPHEDSWPSAPCGWEDRAVGLDGQARAARGITTQTVEARAVRCPSLVDWPVYARLRRIMQ